MGESRGGGGGGQRPTTTDLIALVAAEYVRDGREIEELRLSFVTGETYAAEVSVRGEPENETYFFSIGGLKPAEGAPTPEGGTTGESEATSR